MTVARSHGPRSTRPSTVGRPAVRRVDADAPPRWVRVTCPACGIVRVRVADVVVRNCVDDNTWSYRARCSSCATIFVDSTPASLALPAIVAGVAIETWSLPKPSPRPAGRPLRAADVLQMHLALLEPDWFEALLDAEPPVDH